MTGTTPDFAKLVGELEAHGSIDAMAASVLQAATAAANQRQTKFPLTASSDVAPPEGTEPSEEWTTTVGNTWEVLDRGAKSADQVALVRALLALGTKKNFPSAPEQELAATAQLVWLAAHTTCNAFEPLEVALGSDAKALWQAVATLVERPREGGEHFGRTEAVIAAVALRDASSDTASELATELTERLTDPVLLGILKREPPSPAEPPKLVGELSPPPKSPVVTAVLAFTFVLAISHVTRLIGRYVFAYRRPAKLMLSPRGLEVTHHTEFLGKVLRERATLVPLGNLASITREVRFARLGMYAGLGALVVGSYLGMKLFIDGLRVPGGSATLLTMAVLLILLGLVIDFALSSLSDSVKGKCKIVVILRKGRPVCVGSLSCAEADAVLGAVADKVRV